MYAYYSRARQAKRLFGGLFGSSSPSSKTKGTSAASDHAVTGRAKDGSVLHTLTWEKRYKTSLIVMGGPVGTPLRHRAPFALALVEDLTLVVAGESKNMKRNVLRKWAPQTRSTLGEPKYPWGARIEALPVSDEELPPQRLYAWLGFDGPTKVLYVSQKDDPERLGKNAGKKSGTRGGKKGDRGKSSSVSSSTSGVSVGATGDEEEEGGDLAPEERTEVQARFLLPTISISIVHDDVHSTFAGEIALLTIHDLGE